MKTFIAIIFAIIVIAGAILLFEKHDADTGGIVATSTAVNMASSTPASGGASPGSASRNTPVVGGTETVDMRVSSPQRGATVASPLSISGEVRGNWLFEAVAPVYLEDAAGKKVAEGQIRATGDWMTTNFVPFTGTLTWATTTGTSSASLVFENANPSGDPSLTKTVTVPVTLR